MIIGLSIAVIASPTKATPALGTVVNVVNAKFLITDIVRAVINGIEPRSLYPDIATVVALNPSNPSPLTSLAHLETPLLDYIFNLT